MTEQALRKIRLENEGRRQNFERRVASAERLSNERRAASYLHDLDLPDGLRALVTEGVTNTGVNSGVILCAVLSTLSRAAQGSWRLELDPVLGPVPLSLWFLIEMESGEGKSPVESYFDQAIRDVIDEIEECVVDVTHRFEARLTAWGEVERMIKSEMRNAYKKGADISLLTSRLDDHKRTKPKPPRPLLTNLSDFSKAGVLRAAQGAMPTLNVQSAEGGIVLDHLDNEMLLLANALWRAEEYDIQRGHNSGKIKHVPLSICLYAQPHVVKKFIDRRGRDAWGTGFLQRFLVCRGTKFAESDRVTSAPLSLSEREKLTAVLRALYLTLITPDLAEAIQPNVMRLSEGAKIRFEDFRKELRETCETDTRLKRFRQFCRKLSEIVGRLAGLIFIYEKGGELVNGCQIPREVMEAAISLGRKYLEAYQAFFEDLVGLTDEEREVKALWGYLCREFKANGGESIECRRILRVSTLRTSQQRDRALDVLIEKKYVKRTENLYSKKEMITICFEGINSMRF